VGEERRGEKRWERGGDGKKVTREQTRDTEKERRGKEREEERRDTVEAEGTRGER